MTVYRAIRKWNTHQAGALRREYCNPIPAIRDKSVFGQGSVQECTRGSPRRTPDELGSFGGHWFTAPVPKG